MAGIPRSIQQNSSEALIEEILAVRLSCIVLPTPEHHSKLGHRFTDELMKANYKHVKCLAGDEVMKTSPDLTHVGSMGVLAMQLAFDEVVSAWERLLGSIYGGEGAFSRGVSL